MNTVKKLAVLSIGILVPPAVIAMDVSKDAYVANAKKGPGIPVPISVVTPEGHSAIEGDSADLVFVVDTSGKPTDVKVKSSTDRSLGLAAREAVKQWRFEPARIDGKPVAVKVVVPFFVTKSVSERSAFAAHR